MASALGWHFIWPLTAALTECTYWWQAKAASVMASDGALELDIDMKEASVAIGKLKKHIVVLQSTLQQIGRTTA